MVFAHIVGAKGEETATLYLQSLGYVVHGRNVRFGRYEIDIVAYDPLEKIMVFAEVKTRSHHSENYPIHTAVHWRKRRSMRRAIDRWVEKENYEGPGRTDVICVHRGKVIEHLRDIGSDFF